jgi:SAM-dependent methyltransferase
VWQDYEATYRSALHDEDFLAWRELGAQRKADNIVQLCRNISHASMVEIGCGTGSVIRALHAMDFARHYFCIDISPSAVRFTRGSCAAVAKIAVAGRADALPFPERSFDVAVLSHVIEHLDRPVPALREASRVARFVVVEVPTEMVLSNFVRRKVLRRPYPSIAGAGHVQFWSPSSIATFLERDAGLRIINRHRDLLDESIDSATNWIGQAGLKRTLRNILPGTIYSRLLTTHAAFLCTRTNGPR